MVRARDRDVALARTDDQGDRPARARLPRPSGRVDRTGPGGRAGRFRVSRTASPSSRPAASGSGSTALRTPLRSPAATATSSAPTRGGGRLDSVLGVRPHHRADPDKEHGHEHRVHRTQHHDHQPDRGPRARAARRLTLRPTSHRYLLDSRTVFAWCASDALTFPVVLGRPGIIEAAADRPVSRSASSSRPTASIASSPRRRRVSSPPASLPTYVRRSASTASSSRPRRQRSDGRPSTQR